ncbi:hypothetical protein H696_00349 [Fonticula alba]|uniref:Anaphase-promoting complex subunit 4 WD40 domain-containing protein n=1 Tax=Fonticula alba TaxID=691883 RepID=A0A058ZED7_FONAL|nr:hypothetical protein H696_00349 [Fonticula alba]KCV72770.1 hypothetical protein H696_00349 [Fonticula alba]|eukprot:XP_009492471.1 hypothetical protein H696_00349 [Fonticula alba]
MFTTLSKVQNAHKGPIWSCTWVPAQAATLPSFVATGSVDETVSLWDPESFNKVHDAKTRSAGGLAINSIVASADGKRIITSSLDNQITVLSVGGATATLESNGDSLVDEAASKQKDDSTPAVRKSAQGDYTVALTATHKIAAGPAESWTVCLSPCGTQIASGTPAGNVNIWQIPPAGAPGSVVEITDKRTINVSNRLVLSVAWSSDGTLIAAGMENGSIALYNIERGQPLPTINDAHSGPVRTVAFSPDSSTLLTGSDDGTLVLHDVNVGSKISTFTGHTSWVLSAAFQPHTDTIKSPNQFISSSADGSVRVWDAQGSSLHVSNTASKNTDSGGCLFSFKEHTDQVWAVSWDPTTCRRAVSVGDDGAIVFYKIN